MSFWRQLSRGWRVLTNRGAADQELSDELQDYLDQATKAQIERGVSPSDARRAALREAGSAASIRDEVRSHGWENMLATSLADLRYGARSLLHNPGFAAVSILTLALGIGASTAIFSAVNPILFETLPYPQASRLTVMWEMRRNGSPLWVTFGTFHGLVERNRSFEFLAVTRPWLPTITGPEEPERLEGQRVSADYFRVLGVAPAMGRDFESSQDRLHGPNVVVLSDGLWRRRFAAEPSIVGHQITLDGDLYTVIGVMPRSFENVFAPEAEVWTPLQYDSSLPPDSKEWGHHLRMIGRLKTGANARQAANEFDVNARILAQIYARGYSGAAPGGMIVNSMQSDLTKAVRPALLAILGAVVLLLLIACVNVTNLLLARGSQRRTEFAVRTALGAQPSRLVKQLLTESLLFSILGAVPGMALAQAGVKALVRFSPPGLPRVNAIHVNNSVFVFAAALTLLVGLLVGLMPALHASRGDPQAGLQKTTRTIAGAHGFTRRTLVVAEVALALVLLSSAGLLLRSLGRLFAIDPGFDASHLLTMQVQEAGQRYQKDDARAIFFERALDAVHALPGVSAAAFTSQLPLSGDFDSYGVEYAAYPNGGDAAFRYAVSPDYFAVMHIPLRSGRLLDDRDRPGSPTAVVISESLARRKFPGQNPVGQRVHIGPAIGHPDQPWAVIVGVVGDVKQLSLALNNPDAFYTTDRQWAWVDKAQSLVVRAPGDPAALAGDIRRAIWSVDKDQPIVRIATMEKLVAMSEAERRFALLLFGVFALAGLLLSAIGMYGVLSGSVTERIREIGVRSALGASRGDILAMVLRQGLSLTAIGTMLGLVGALIASQAVASMLFGISALDPVTYIGIVGLLAMVSVVACWVPAWRASRVEPSITLRAE